MASYESADAAVVVCDVGTSTTRLGYAGNADPTWVQPTLAAWRGGAAVPCPGDGFVAGSDAAELIGVPRHSPLEHGAVVDWNVMEEYWRHVFSRRLCVEPQDVSVLLTEPACTAPAQRATTAEMMFEGFGVPRLCVGSQAHFALSSLGDGCDTGVVVECGAGVTQVVPIVAGYAVAGAARRFPVAGRDITQYVLQHLRTRERGVDAARALEVAERVKTRHCRVARDAAQALALRCADASWRQPPVRHAELHACTVAGYAVNVGPERLLAAEAMFAPELLGAASHAGLDALVDEVVWSSPIDCRRPLLRNILISGGAARFLGFARRLQRLLRRALEERAAGVMAASGSALDRSVSYELTVRDGAQVEHAVWRGASAFAASADYAGAAVTRAEYLECGPAVMCRSRA